MTSHQHQITPPAELVRQWCKASSTGEIHFCPQDLATRAAQWSADQELEACCEVVNRWVGPWHPGIKLPDRLRAARRPKPPSLKEQALNQLDAIQLDLNRANIYGANTDTIRKALESIND